MTTSATELFMSRGFGGFRVADVAGACDVSEATVFNYFSTKEALVLDRLDVALDALRISFATPGVDPLRAVERILEIELTSITGWLNAQDDPSASRQMVIRFGDLVAQTPALLAYQSFMFDNYVAAAVEVLATRAGLSPDDPEPQIAARSVMCLWLLQAQSLRRHLHSKASNSSIPALVKADVRRAAALLQDGLRPFMVTVTTH
jgi:AcrR family transcriptional regulator